jgi:hypothetical protein
MQHQLMMVGRKKPVRKALVTACLVKKTREMALDHFPVRTSYPAVDAVEYGLDSVVEA